MKILVNTEFLELGGSIVTAVELAAAVRDRHGHDVVFFARNGPARDLLESRDLRLVEAAERGHELGFVWSLRRACREERPDIVHSWDRRAIHAGYYAAQLMGGLPMLGSVTEMLVPPFLAVGMPVTYVTEEIRAGDRHRRSLTFLQDPPINVGNDHPGAADGDEWRREHGLAPAGEEQAIVVVTVSRLSHRMKLESILHTVGAVGLVGDRLPIEFLIVGDGPARPEVEARAAEVNSRLGREAVRLLGAMVDPRPAYAGADIVVGMGTSVVRGMAFDKPVIVVGELGYAEIFTPLSSDRIAKSGFFGFGSGTDVGAEHLAGLLEELIARRDEWPSLGELGRSVTCERFAVEPVADSLAKRYEEVAAMQPDRRWSLFARNFGRTLMAMGVSVAPDAVRQTLGETVDTPTPARGSS